MALIKEIRLQEALDNSTTPNRLSIEEFIILDKHDRVNYDDFLAATLQIIDEYSKLKGNTGNYSKPAEMFGDMVEILYGKTIDYNADRANDPNFRLDDARTEYFPFGKHSYLHMIHTKASRINSVKKMKETNFESLEDSYIDLLAYMTFYFSYLYHT